MKAAGKRKWTVRDGKIVADEDVVHAQVKKWLDYQHPGIIYHSDAAGELMTDSMRIRQSRVNLADFKFPDLQLMEARGGYFGMMIELKRDDEKLFKANGMYVNDHVEAQARSLEKLRGKGYFAAFSKGFEETTKAINLYLSLPPTKIVKPKKEKQ